MAIGNVLIIDNDSNVSKVGKIINQRIKYYKMTIFIDYCLGDQIENVQPEPKQMLWQYAPDGDVAFEYLMDEGAEYIMKSVMMLKR